MKSIGPLFLLVSLSFWAGAQRADNCQENNKVICNESDCALLMNQVSNCCDYKKTYSRYANGKQYTLLNPCEHILLYKHEIKVSKWPQYEYYFSQDIESPILKLTRENLKIVYADNTEFQEKLDMVFRNDGELSRFDGLYNMHLVNWLYNQVTQ